MNGREYDRAKVGASLGLGLGFALSTLAFAGLGYLLDRHIGATPVFTLLGAFVGGAAGFYSLYRHAIAIQKGDVDKQQPDNQSEEPPAQAPDAQ
ncbi:MAG: hypothetical protein AMS25_09735 [Gemmatimonas sp. SM23_52]|nr:MAG: hypothetical protein AMS25_09735 [Gemmatimonas sp. SM23_52]